MPVWTDINPEGPVSLDSFVGFEAVAGYKVPNVLREHLEVVNGGYCIVTAKGH